MPLLVGDPAPWFKCECTTNPNYNFDTVAGRYVVLSFFGSTTLPQVPPLLRFIYQDLRPRFDDSNLCFFGVSIDPQDKEQHRVTQIIPGIRFFWDFNLEVSKRYGAVRAEEGAGFVFQPFTLVLDPNLRVLANIPINENHNLILDNVLKSLPPIDDYAQVPLTAPILIVPRVFEPEFCRELIRLYQTHGGSESGFMREKDGKTIGVQDYSFKRRKDYEIQSEEIKAHFRACLVRRLVPEIAKAFNFHVTRIERFIVACYEGEVGGFFRPHRDNTTKGTAHRRFAVTINLNAEEYEGGDLRFPEYGSRTYRAPTGGCVVFSCSILHEATPVTKGVRYATLPFLYDEAAAKIREMNRQFLSGEIVDLNQQKTLQT
ncbi:MAG: 2OG-Fe(II) oxygenase [Pseudanabaenaceae cyanobacterium SKYGB_i_bin29]|nr:2OG-Fe(II) oxygenase [Pseudanabaenaceae cyanobacterium SKYG29]MDW8421213.1 2OG-Fe(II) oxygenase [Pseudanabaenaceae cyanobacterium SKYGB_i_bin29]